MKVALTGATGQVGRALRRAAPADVDLVCLSRGELDLEQPETIASAIADLRPELLINAAAYTAVDAAEDEPDRQKHACSAEAQKCRQGQFRGRCQEKRGPFPGYAP